MKVSLLIILTFRFISLNAQLHKHNPDDYYSVSTLTSKILKINEGELIFYGDEGNVLRTYDNCETFHQSFSGTKSSIKKLISKENIVYGVTSDGNFMKSDDKGDWWNYKKISTSLTDIIFYNHNIVISNNSDTLFLSADEGHSWNKIKLNIDSIRYLSVFNNRLIVNTTTNKTYISSENNFDLEFHKTPFTYNFIKSTNDNFYVYSTYSIAKLKEDLTWERHDIFETQRNFEFLDKDNEYIIFSPDFAIFKDLGLNIFEYNKQSKSKVLLHNYKDDRLAIEQVNYLEYLPTDIIESNGSVIISSYYKTILKTEDLINWDLKSNNTIYKSRIRTLFDKENIFITKPSKSILLKSTNSGKTFEFHNEMIKDTIDGEIFIPNVINFIAKNKRNYLLLYDLLSNGRNGGAKTVRKRLALNVNDTLKRLEHIIVNYNFSLNEYYISDFFGDEYLLHVSNKILTKEKNKNNFFEDSIRKTIFYKVSEKSLDTLGEINDSISNYSSMIDGNKIWIWGKSVIPNSNNEYLSKLFLSEDSCKTFKEMNINDAINTEITLYKDANGNYILIRGKNIDIYNKEFILNKTISSEYDYIVNGTLNIKMIDGLTFIGVKEINQGNVISYKEIRFYFDDNYNILEFEQLLDGRWYTQSIDNRYQIYNKFLGLQTIFYIPIENDRLTYYTSVMERPIPPSIWTFPPYPNPVKDILKMRFYSAMMNKIAKLQVELIEIGSGKSYKIKKYNVTSVDNFWGEIELDLSGHEPGAYLINFKIGGSNKSETIIIE